MSANTSLGSDAQPTKDDRPARGWDGRKTAHDDASDESTNNQPNPPHGHVSHGAARFLWWVGQRRQRIDGFDPTIEELGDLWDEWRESNDLGQQTTFDSAGWDDAE